MCACQADLIVGRFFFVEAGNTIHSVAGVDCEARDSYLRDVDAQLAITMTLILTSNSNTYKIPSKGDGSKKMTTNEDGVARRLHRIRTQFQGELATASATALSQTMSTCIFESWTHTVILVLPFIFFLVSFPSQLTVGFKANKKKTESVLTRHSEKKKTNEDKSEQKKKRQSRFYKNNILSSRQWLMRSGVFFSYRIDEFMWCRCIRREYRRLGRLDAFFTLQFFILTRNDQSIRRWYLQS